MFTTSVLVLRWGKFEISRYKSEEYASKVSFPWHLRYFPTLFAVWNLLSLICRVSCTVKMYNIICLEKGSTNNFPMQVTFSSEKKGKKSVKIDLFRVIKRINLKKKKHNSLYTWIHKIKMHSFRFKWNAKDFIPFQITWDIAVVFGLA